MNGKKKGEKQNKKFNRIGERYFLGEFLLHFTKIGKNGRELHPSEEIKDLCEIFGRHLAFSDSWSRASTSRRNIVEVQDPP